MTFKAYVIHHVVCQRGRDAAVGKVSPMAAYFSIPVELGVEHGVQFVFHLRP
jgi:hypothetical protein